MQAWAGTIILEVWQCILKFKIYVPLTQQPTLLGFNQSKALEYEDRLVRGNTTQKTIISLYRRQWSEYGAIVNMS